jgi:hypothetical protein
MLRALQKLIQTIDGMLKLFLVIAKTDLLQAPSIAMIRVGVGGSGKLGTHNKSRNVLHKIITENTISSTSSSM